MTDLKSSNWDGNQWLGAMWSENLFGRKVRARSRLYNSWDSKNKKDSSPVSEAQADDVGIAPWNVSSLGCQMSSQKILKNIQLSCMPCFFQVSATAGNSSGLPSLA